jgi:hypothetical protein
LSLFIAALIFGVSLVLAGVVSFPRGEMACLGFVPLGVGTYLLLKAGEVRLDTPQQARARKGKPRRAWMFEIPLFAGAATLLAVIAIEMATPEAGKSQEVPPSGTVVSAQTGEVVTSFQRSTPQDAQVGGGDIFRVCDRTTEHPCQWLRESPPIKVEDGDLIEFGILLNNGGDAAVPYARLTVERWGGGITPEKTNPMSAKLDIQWNTGISRGVHAEVKLEAKGRQGFTDFNYVPGSTVLRTRNHRLLGRLPDGIMDNGIALANIGSPASCYYCDQRYIRLVFFEARVNEGAA